LSDQPWASISFNVAVRQSPGDVGIFWFLAEDLFELCFGIVTTEREVDLFAAVEAGRGWR